MVPNTTNQRGRLCSQKCTNYHMVFPSCSCVRWRPHSTQARPRTRRQKPTAQSPCPFPCSSQPQFALYRIPALSEPVDIYSRNFPTFWRRVLPPQSSVVLRIVGPLRKLRDAFRGYPQAMDRLASRGIVQISLTIGAYRRRTCKARDATNLYNKCRWRHKMLGENLIPAASLIRHID